MSSPVFAVRVLTFVAACLLVGCGCRRGAEDSVQVAPGVLFRRDPAAKVQILDADLAAAAVQPVVVASHIERRRGNIIGDAKTVLEWADEYGAVGGINAGFFGDTYDTIGRRKQLVGLSVVDGEVIGPGGKVNSTRQRGEQFLRSVIGFTPEGRPEMVWATGTTMRNLKRYPDPVNPTRSHEWRSVRWAVACGPRLFAGGARRITDHEERLLSPKKLYRAFVAYDDANHLVLGRAENMTFVDVADWIEAYFQSAHQTRPAEAMCLDGGPSAQIVYRDGENGPLRDAEPTGVLVPTAILLVPKKK